ncbi:MAG TPA: hypothetical protein VF611_14075 [Pyrinomonadaceae bacterium]
MKYIVVLILFAAAAAYAYWRLRPYIRGARRLFGALREVNRVRAGARASDLPAQEKRKAAANERLLRCAACGTWMPASRAVSLRAGATYCSHACLERAADSPRKARKSAS